MLEEKIINSFFKKTRPNLIMLVLDQVRYDFLSKYEIFKILREKGTLFSEMITYAPYTVSSLHAILSGLYGRTNGVDAYYGAMNFRKEKCFTLSQYLQRRGYFTQADTINGILLPKQGFDKILLYDENNVDIITRHTQMLREMRNLKKNFFLFLHYMLIHQKVVENVIRKYTDFDTAYFGKIEENKQRYDGYVLEAVLYLKTIFKLIEDLGFLDNSLLIVLTDHGSGLGEKPGEKAYGIYTYDYAIKTWAYFIYPKQLPCGLEIKELTRTIDILPTIIELFKIRPLKKYLPLEGESLLPLIKGEEKKERIAFAETGGLDGPTPSPEKPNVKCIRTEKWKLIYNTTTKKRELYNIIKDPSENENLSGNYPEIENKLWNILKDYLDSESIADNTEIIKRELRKLGYLPK